MAISANLGFPRIGDNRQLKRALENYWAGRATAEELLAAATQLRKAHWALQNSAGLDHIPSGDFALYDHVLDAAVLVGAVPSRFTPPTGPDDLDALFALPRGLEGTPAMEMTKWFDTNYHYIVPEFEPDTKLALAEAAPVQRFQEARDAGVTTRPVLLGPVSFLLLAKPRDGAPAPLTHLDALVDIYKDLLAQLAAAGADWVQIDEPWLVMDLDAAARDAYRTAYATLADTPAKLMLTTYFGQLGDNLELACSLPANGLHVDLVRGAGQLDDVLSALPAERLLSLGVVDGRNIWRTDLRAALDKLTVAADKLGPDRLAIAPSCSLLHCPVDLDREDQLDDELKSWLAFATQKLHEVVTLTRAVNEGESAVAGELADNARAMDARRSSSRIHNPHVKQRLAGVDASMLARRSRFPQRRDAQRAKLNLPAWPTTTIGSFPQTPEIRNNRAAYRLGQKSRDEYEQFLEAEIARVVQFQEEIGLDVLVHGEPERNDMVEYFGEQLEGFAHTRFGWVQSYGSRCVKPPIIFGDVHRPEPMTVRWSRHAQSLTDKPMKGMLTGPVTILQWSFVRDDQPRWQTCNQIALAIRDEVVDLESAGIGVIQIDEPAIREGLPLRDADAPAYLRWAVDAFRLASAGVADETQIHTHMCYSEFNEIIEAVGEMDADVITIESSRSHMELLDAFVRYKYPNEIGPGVYDIHSPRVPSVAEMVQLLRKAAAVLPADQLWVNPDCGLKTRKWPETIESLTHMVAAAQQMRQAHVPA